MEMENIAHRFTRQWAMEFGEGEGSRLIQTSHNSISPRSVFGGKLSKPWKTL